MSAPGHATPKRPPPTAPATPPRPAKVMIVDVSPAAARPSTGSRWPEDFQCAMRALPATARTVKLVGGYEETQLRHKRDAILQQQTAAMEDKFRCTSACVREVTATIYRALGVRSNVSKLSISVATACRASYLEWLGSHTALLQQHLAAMHSELPGTTQLGPQDTLALVTALAGMANNANKVVHSPSLADVAAALQDLAARPSRFPGINASHLGQLIRLLLRGSDLTAPGTPSTFADWTAAGSFARAVEESIKASAAWSHSALVQGCHDEVNPEWQKKEFERYITHLANLGMAVRYQEWMDLFNDYSATEVEKRDAEAEVSRMGVQMEEMKKQIMETCALNEVHEERIVELEGENEQQARRLTVLEQGNKQQAHTITDLEGENEQQARRLTILEQENKQQARTITDLEGENEQQARRLTVLEQENKQQARTITDLEGENEQQARRLTVLEQENKQQARTITNLKFENKQQDMTIKKQAARIDGLENTVALLTARVSSLDDFIRAHLPQAATAVSTSV
ncbi:hypothetical protein DFH27DRAFT_604358 [Peziza echinospora]|nr:hypothetical protein DFH27DRAFT_604358 [Peziza echinospora]